MELIGTVEDIIFKNEDNGYTVASLSYFEDFIEKLITITGTLPDVKVGQSLKLEGNLKNTKYGEQFAFTNAEITYPNTLSGIKKYLESGLIKGVGPVTASQIVQTFKNDTLYVIEFNPELLSKVRGISKRKALQISESFNEIKKMQNSVMFLQKYNITINMAIKIYNTYADKTIEIVQTNPYRLIEDVDGIGFLTADRIAKSMGIADNSIFRIRAGFIHCLQDNSEKNGNTCIHREKLLKETSNLLNLDIDTYIEKFDQVLCTLGDDHTIMNFKTNTGAQVIMLSKLYFTENMVAQKLALLNITSKTTDIDITQDIHNFEILNKIKFDKQQKNAIENSIKSGVSVITGGPGTGKTTIIKCIINILEQLNQTVMLLAPTGRASKRLSESTGREAKTIHRGLEINFKGENKYFVHNESNPLDVNVVIVDEVSMVDIFLMSSLLKALPRDCKLILVGDKDQLPSVGAGNILSDILKSNLIQVSYLTKIFRQDEKSLIVTNAHAINNGEMPIIDNTSTDFFFENKETPEEICKTIVDLTTKRLPKFFNIDPQRIQILAPLKAGLSGSENLNIELQNKLNPPQFSKQEITIGKTTYREGDKIMQIVNDYDITWKKFNGIYEEEGMGVFNGDIGYIHKINYGSGETVIWFEDGREAIYPKTQLDELALAYSITIHKSQGSEFDIVVIPIISGPSIILTKNLIYTAVTRAKKVVVMVGNQKNLKRMITNKYTAERLTLLKEFLIEANEKLRLIYQ